MAKKNEMTSDDLMQLPQDIAGLVLDVQGRQTQQPASAPQTMTTPVEKQPVRTEEVSKPASIQSAMPKDGNEWWNTFLKMGEGYAYRTRKTDRKMYWIDEDIVTALKACDINRMSATDIINAILRSFIELNKGELRECFKHHDSLI